MLEHAGCNLRSVVERHSVVAHRQAVPNDAAHQMRRPKGMTRESTSDTSCWLSVEVEDGRCWQIYRMDREQLSPNGLPHEEISNFPDSERPERPFLEHYWLAQINLTTKQALLPTTSHLHGTRCNKRSFKARELGPAS